MLRPLAALVLAALVSAPTASAAPGAADAGARPARTIPGRYIVTVRDDADPRAVAAIVGSAPRHLYRSALRGFAGDLTEGQLTALRRRPDVVAIEPDAVVAADTTQTLSGGEPWGLDRIDERSFPLTSSFTYTRTGSGVRAYVLDTGIQASHPQFGTRAQAVYDAFGGSGQDCNGHGTHVAGTIGASTYGVAKGALLRGVRVLDCAGSGSTSGIIAGVDWVRANALRPAVANLSLGGGASAALDSAVTNLANAGIFVAVAAGNEGQNACRVSPAAAPAAYTVAATDRTDTRASFSNYGSCVDGYAPGVAVRSTWPGSTVRSISGTSMASPHVAGVAALYKSAFGDAASATIAGWLNGNATAGVVRSNVTGTPNRLLFTAGL